VQDELTNQRSTKGFARLKRRSCQS